MKRIIFLIILLSIPILAQTEYEITPGIRGNQIILSIENESKSESIEKLYVSAIKIPQSIELKNSSITLEGISGKNIEDALFTFDVARIPKAIKDTIRFAIIDKLGNQWNKEIIVKYSLPTEFKLEQNYPNPFNPTTTIEYTLPKEGRYTLRIFNVLGETVKVLADDIYSAGYYKVNFNASEYSSGIYFYSLIGSEVNIVKKMVLMK